MSWKRHWNYFKYICRHKYYVFVEGMKLHVPIYLLILHDWSKFLPNEWLPYARCFYAKDGTKQYNETAEFARAWMLHQHRNKHHWQHWLFVNDLRSNFSICKSNFLVWDRGEASFIDIYVDPVTVSPALKFFRFSPDIMPLKYCLEMLADWKGASRTITGADNTKDWYYKNKDNMILHSETRKWIEKQLGVIG